MATDNLDALRFPVGKFSAVADADSTVLNSCIDDIAAAPAIIATVSSSLSAAQLLTPYREGGWTGAQVVHHLADSHVNAYIRTRFALAEDHFTVKPYDENRWAQFVDATSADIAPSISILTGLHARWATLLRTLTPEQFTRQLLHPERGPMTLSTLIQLYAWHGKHHAGHLRIIAAQPRG